MFSCVMLIYLSISLLYQQLASTTHTLILTMGYALKDAVLIAFTLKIEVRGFENMYLSRCYGKTCQYASPGDLSLIESTIKTIPITRRTVP